MENMVKYPQIDNDKIDIVKERLRKKSTVWFSFLLLGWSYGSLGNLGIQLIWYLVTALTGYGIYENIETGEFTVFTAIALMGLPIWAIWSVVRVFTLNKAVDKYNRQIANIFGLNEEEKYALGIE
jgi:hypothetical protein